MPRRHKKRLAKDWQNQDIKAFREAVRGHKQSHSTLTESCDQVPIYVQSKQDSAWTHLGQVRQLGVGIQGL